MNVSLNSIRRGLARLIAPGIGNSSRNKFNEAFLLNGEYTAYDQNAKSYIEKGYNVNPLVYAPINQMSTKTASIPYNIKKVEDSKSFNKRKQLKAATNMQMSLRQKVKYAALEVKAFSEDEIEFPMERPNPNQSWTEFIALYKTFLKTTGNVYWYDLMPEDGANKGMPIASYLLPSHMMQIVLKGDLKLSDTLNVDDPVRGYILTEGAQYLEFSNEEVIHIKYPNPNYSLDGEHLYGMSPLRAALRNIQSSNLGIDLNIKTQKNGGAFGFIHAKQTPLTEGQAKELKERLVEMNNSAEDLGKLAGVSAEVGFTRISLTSDELKPFDYLAFDENKISECLDWAVIDGKRGDFGGTINEIRKQRVVDNIMPDLDLLANKLNKEWLPKFKGYENTVIEWDVMELPEMQDDLKEVSTYLLSHQAAGNFNGDEVRMAMRYPPSGDPNHQIFTVKDDIIPLSEAINSEFNTNDGDTSEV